MVTHLIKISIQKTMEASKQSVHIVLVHGACHGAWCWYKLKPLLEAAGYRVTALNLAASGIDRRSLDEVHSFADYTQPLLELLAAIPAAEKVVLVGHSLGGMNLGVAMDAFPHKISVAVFLAAFMPDVIHPPSFVIQQFMERIPAEEWLDTKFLPFGPAAEDTKIYFGPKFVSSKLYQLCPPEDMALANSLLRPSSFFIEDLKKKAALSKQGYGSVKRVYIVCTEDQTIPVDFQRWQVETIGADEVKVMENIDHMPMLCDPNLLSQYLIDVATTYA